MVPPFSWFFKNARTAFIMVLFLVCGFWGALVLSRWWYWTTENIFWNHEIVLLGAFSYAGFLSVFLAKRFHQLFHSLSGKNQNLDELLQQISTNFHRKRWLVFFPIALSAFAISIRFYTADYLMPFRQPVFEYFFLLWVFLGFCLLLHATILIGRYSEMIRIFGDASQKGWLHRLELHKISHFYFEAAMYVSIYFVFCAFTVFALHLIYSYSGNIWPGYFLIRQLPGLILSKNFAEIQTNIVILYEVILLGILHLAACIAALAYFVLPQWGVHQLLRRQKRKLLEKIENDLLQSESQMTQNPTEANLEKFARWSLIQERVGNLPEWPFSDEGWLGTILLIGIPSLIVFFKEVFLETLINLITK